MKIPFLDLKLVNTPLFPEISEAFERVSASGWYILGPEVKAFETLFADYCESNFCVGTANGLDAIHLILKCFEFPEGSEIIVPANTYFATILAVIQAGYRPVFVEPLLSTYLIDPDKIEENITSSTRAVLVTELYGKSCELTSIKALCKKYHLKLISDSAQSHGALYKNQKSAGHVDAAAFSFYPTKNLGALGDGGAVVTNDKALANRIAERRNYGSSQKYHFAQKGLNSRLDELQAAILSLKLSRLDEENAKRRSIAKRYLTQINNPKIVLPPADTIQEDAWHLFVVRTENREHFRKYLENAGIQSDIHYPIPPHQQKALEEFSYLTLPITEKIHLEVTSIPLNTYLSHEEINYIIVTLNQY